MAYGDSDEAVSGHRHYSCRSSQEFGWTKSVLVARQVPLREARKLIACETGAELAPFRRRMLLRAAACLEARQRQPQTVGSTAGIAPAKPSTPIRAEGQLAGVRSRYLHWRCPTSSGDGVERAWLAVEPRVSLGSSCWPNAASLPRRFLADAPPCADVMALGIERC